MLGVARGELLSQPFTRYICKENQDIYYLNNKRLLVTGEPLGLDLRMKKDDGVPFWGHLTATPQLKATTAQRCAALY